MDSQSVALATIIGLSRLSRLTLLYHSAAASAADGGVEQAAALAGAAAAAAEGDVVVAFDAGSDLPVPDLLADIEAAVLEAAPHAPLAPPMAGPVDALAFWQQALGVRFLLLVRRFDIALSRQDPEFDEVLHKLANDPLDLSVLLLMDEAAAPLLQRLKHALPELGETFLRLPEPAGAAPAEAAALADEPALPAPLPAPRAVPAAPAARFGPSPFLFDEPDDDPEPQAMRMKEEADEATPPAGREPGAGRQERQEQQPQAQEPRRSRHFSMLLEQARGAPEAFEPPAGTAPAAFDPAPPGDLAAPAVAAVPVANAPPTQIYPAAAPPEFAAPDLSLPDGRAEPSFEATPAQPAASAGARVFSERRPLQVAAWMQKRRGRRRRDTVGIASRVGSSSTVLFVLMMVLAVLGWQMPQLGAPAGASLPRAAATQAPGQAVALRGNRYRRSISSAASPAGTGRDAR